MNMNNSRGRRVLFEGGRASTLWAAGLLAAWAQPGPAPGAAGGPPMVLNKPTAQTHFIAAIDIKDGLYLPEQSTPAAVKGSILNDAASKLAIESKAPNFNGLYVNGAKSAFTLSDSKIELFGGGTGDFDGVAAGVLVSQGATLVLKHVHISTHGVVSTDVTATEHSILKVYDSTLMAYGGPLPAGYVPKIGPGMMEPPAPLGITGTARASLTMDHAKSYYYNSKITANGWGALSTDATGGYVYLEANNCDIRTIKSGYGTYADGGAQVVINNSRMDTATYTGIIAGPGTFHFNNIHAKSGRNSVMIHSVMGSPAEKAELQIKGGDITTQDAVILVKSANADIVLDGAKLTSKSGELLDSRVNDDKFATKVNGQKVYGIRATLKNEHLDGNIRHGDSERTMSVVLMASTLKGAISNASVSLEAQSKWTATADSTVTLVGKVEIADIDAASGVTITATAGKDCTLKGSYKLASGGVLNVKSG
jgi:hypothetical protein